jgi:hypothetical protein
MRHVPSLKTACALLALSASAAACKVTDPLYCDQNTPCTDQARPFCDLNGEYTASEGIKRTCIPYPWDAAPDTDAGPACTPGEWTLDTIDPNTANEPALAVDSSGAVHVAWRGGTTSPGVLYYAHGRAGAWTVVETPEAGGFYPKMAIDSTSNLHLVHGGYPGGLRYLHKAVSDEEFEYELVAPELAFDIGFDLNASEMPVACFLDGEAAGPPRCHQRTGEQWDPIESPAIGTKSGIAIAIDTANKLHMTADGLVYLSWNGADWSTEEVVDDNAEFNAGLALDSGGGIHAVFRDRINGHVKHAYRAGADNWSIDDVERNVDGQSPAIFIDRNDVIHITYVDATNSNLKYARRDGDAWDTKTIDSTASIPGEPRLFVDSDLVPHIAYVDRNDGELRYAFLCP